MDSSLSYKTPNDRGRALLEQDSESETDSYQSPSAIHPISHIRVVARIRPMNQEEAKRGGKRSIRIQESAATEPPRAETGILSRLRSSFSSPTATPTKMKESEHCLDEGIVLTMHCSDSKIGYNNYSSNQQQEQQLLPLPTIVATESSSGHREFEMDAVFGPLSTQQFVYEHSLPNMAEHLFQGYNTTILAYGQTGSGKTFTMGGQKDARTLAGDDYLAASNSSLLDCSDENDGIIPRAVRDIFQFKHDYEDRQFSVQVKLSCLEIYQDELRDLLPNAPAGSTTALKMQDHGHGVSIRGLQTCNVHTMSHMHNLMEQATLRRTTASTRLNERSSRSHAVCTVSITVAPPSSLNTKRDAVVTAKLTLVDLAGSERIKDTGVVGVQQQESININKDLFVLGKVVSALSDRAKRGGDTGSHIPYRDSKLTRLLRDSLGGNCRTVLIACVSPADVNAEESINTLRYAERSRTIANVVKQNLIKAVVSPSEHAALRAENKKLRNMVLHLKKALGGANKASDDILGDQLSGLQEKLKAAECEAKMARDLSVAAVDQANRAKARESCVSPLLTYELSMSHADDDDLESLIDDTESLWSVDDGARQDASLLQNQIALLKDEKKLLADELCKLSKEVAAKQSYLSELRTNVHTEVQKRDTDAALIGMACQMNAHELVESHEKRHQDNDLNGLVQELRCELRASQATNDRLELHNADLQRELAQLRDHCKQESLKLEISQIERRIEQMQGSKLVPPAESSRSPGNVLQDAIGETNKPDEAISATPTTSIKKRFLSANCEEEKKSEDLTFIENNNPLQPLLDELSTCSCELPYNDGEDESYILSKSASPAEHLDVAVVPSESMKDVVNGSSNEIKQKAEEILDAAERIFLDGSSRASVAASAVSSTGTFFLPGNGRDDSQESNGKIIISNIGVADQCTCEDSLFGVRKDHVEFYLPELGVACSCGRGKPANALKGDPFSLSNILRTWQCDFLASIGIYGAKEYVKAFKERGHGIAADMRRWRRTNGFLSVKTKSCVIALHIWSKTCRTVVQSVREQRARGVAKPERPDFLQIAISHDAASVSTMGFGSVVNARAEI
ncbi:hypothetical protein MPSEU_000775400 [Mayamaea pseudoterrestris]|nr:hypothetical protein MPSEU_000775400 [Mayamaea pseudoterrestris]